MCWNYRAYQQKNMHQMKTTTSHFPSLSLSLSQPVANFYPFPKGQKSTPDSGFAMFAASGRSVKIRMSSYGNFATGLVDPPTKKTTKWNPNHPVIGCKLCCCLCCTPCTSQKLQMVPPLGPRQSMEKNMHQST